MKEKNKKVIVFLVMDDNFNGGPSVFSKMVVESKLKEKYSFVLLFIPFKSKFVLDIKLILEMIKKIKKSKADIVCFSGLQLEGFLSSVVSFLSGKKSIMFIHGSSEESFFFPFWKKKIIKIIEHISLTLVSQFVCISEYVNSWEKVRIHNKKNKGIIYNLYPDLPKKITFYQDKKFKLITTIGRLTKEKGYDNFIEIVKYFNIKKPEIKFVIVGEGEYKNYLSKVRNEYNLKNLFVIGYLKNVYKILSITDIYVSCSLHETFNRTLLEASIIGIPSIVNDVGGMREIVKHGETGFLVKKNKIDTYIEKINFFLDNEDIRRNFGLKAKKYTQTKFERDKILEKLNFLFSEKNENQKN
ncbi:MAG: glycosyltransferase [candidate division WOR-3 bacterium]